jgi:hypothetical protein
MDITIPLNTLRSLKSSFSNILAFVVHENGSDTQKISCLTKWGAQLGFRQAELNRLILTPSLLTYQAPATSIDALAQVYDLVYMVYMDGVIEDVELDLVSLYATGVGLEAHVVNDLLKALVSAQMDGIPNEEIRLDLKSHPEVYV